jgi:hypothetical protein
MSYEEEDACHMRRRMHVICQARQLAVGCSRCGGALANLCTDFVSRDVTVIMSCEFGERGWSGRSTWLVRTLVAVGWHRTARLWKSRHYWHPLLGPHKTIQIHEQMPEVVKYRDWFLLFSN